MKQGIPRWQLEARLFVPAKRRGAAVGLTKRGKGSKLMVVADGNGLPIGLTIASSRPYEVKLAVATLETVSLPRRRGRPRELVADMAYDGRQFRQWLWGKGIKPTITVNPRKRKRPGRPIEVGQHYGERWKVEWLFSWLGNFRRLLVRQDRYLSIFRAFVLVAFIVICLRQF